MKEIFAYFNTTFFEKLLECVTVSTKIPKQLKEEMRILKFKRFRILRKAIEDEINRKKAEQLEEEIDKTKFILEKVRVEDTIKGIWEDRDSSRWNTCLTLRPYLELSKENKIDVLIGNNTLEVTRYELGNIVLKDFFLKAKISKDEAKTILKSIKHPLTLM